MLIRKTIVLALLLSVLAAPVVCLAAEGVEFRPLGGAAPPPGKGLATDPSYSYGGTFFMSREPEFIRVISPLGLSVPASTDAVWLRLRSDGDGFGKVMLGLKGKRKVVTKEFHIRGGPRYRDYKLYTAAGEDIDRFAVHIQDASLDVDIEFIRFISPGVMLKLASAWAVFWEPDEIKGTTVNFITTPSLGGVSFLTALYALIIAAGVIAAAQACGAALRSRDGARAVKETTLRAVLLAFCLVVSLFSVRMDYNWFKIWQKDFRELAAVDVDGRIPLVFYGFEDLYGFVKFVKSAVPEGAKVRPAVVPASKGLGFYMSWVRYFLLPTRTSSGADYIFVDNSFGAMGVEFDAASRTLMRAATVVAAPVELVERLDDRGAVYKVIHEE